MDKQTYWRLRFEQLQESQFKKSEACLNEIKKQYQIALENIEKDLMIWYQRFAINNETNLSDVRRLLNSKELSELKWSVEEYIKYGQENAINQMWMKELENASARVHITRLEAIKLQIQQHLEVLYGNELTSIEKLLKNIYSETYYHTAFEVAKGIGVATKFFKLDNTKLDKVIKKPWTVDGINFSERIWGKHRPKLINELHTHLTQSIIRGEDPQVAINAIAKIFDVSRNQAGNLIMTESAFFASVSQKDCYKELDVEQYEIVATLDVSTSKICRGLDGKVFYMKDYQVGVTAPPFHNYCRSVTCPYFDDEFTVNEKRIATNSDRKSYYIDSNIKYNEWYDKYVKEDISLKKSNNTSKENDIIKLPKKLKLDKDSILNESIPFVDNIGLKQFIPKNSVIKNVVVMAGSGTSTEFRAAKKYAQYKGGHYTQWRKMVGKITSDKYVFDVHWVEHDVYGKFDAKVKPNFSERVK